MCTRSIGTSVVLMGTLWLGLLARPAAAEPTKDECLAAHSRGQDHSEARHLALARDSFAICSQPACPPLVQSDCAAFSEELARLTPSVSFVARSDSGNDLPETQVYIDGALIARRLDDGRTFDVDPGKHAVRFVHDERSVLLNVVITEGEHGRNLVATFTEHPESLPAPAPMTRMPALDLRSSLTAPSSSPRSALPIVLVIGGGAALATGAVLAGVGLGKIPSSCSLDTNECSAGPGAPAFRTAHHGVSLLNAGLVLAIAGAAIGTGGLIWYFSQPTESRPPARAALRFTGAGFVF